MPETPYAETEALLAILNDDEPAALRILADMFPSERRRFADTLDRLSFLANDTFRCPRCDTRVEPMAAVSVGLTSPRRHWHRPCLEAQRAEDAAPRMNEPGS